MLRLVEAAVAAKIDLIQIREKSLTDHMLFELCVAARELTAGTETRLLVNDRADIARAAEADGVHLTTRSLAPSVIRKLFGRDFLIGASTHSINEIDFVTREGADFCVFGPVFETESKMAYGPPVGLAQLQLAASSTDIPLLALGGIRLENAGDCFRTGASGVAAITLLNDVEELSSTAQRLRAIYSESVK